MLIGVCAFYLFMCWNYRWDFLWPITMLDRGGIGNYSRIVENNLMDKGLHTNGNSISVLNNALTIRGKEFIKYILGE